LTLDFDHNGHSNIYIDGPPSLHAQHAAPVISHGSNVADLATLQPPSVSNRPPLQANRQQFTVTHSGISLTVRCPSQSPLPATKPLVLTVPTHAPATRTTLYKPAGTQHHARNSRNQSLASNATGLSNITDGVDGNEVSDLMQTDFDEQMECTEMASPQFSNDFHGDQIRGIYEDPLSALLSREQAPMSIRIGTNTFIFQDFRPLPSVHTSDHHPTGGVVLYVCLMLTTILQLFYPQGIAIQHLYRLVNCPWHRSHSHIQLSTK
jgi:hypothetical protein